MDWPKPKLNGGKDLSMMCIVRVTEKDHLSPVSYYRGYQPAAAMAVYDKQFGVEILTQKDIAERINMLGSAADRLLLGRNIYSISRLFRSKGLDIFLDAIHGSGGLVVFDTDDDLTEEHRHLDGRGDEFIHTASEMDLVTVSTPYLAKQMEKYVGYRPVVLSNHIDVGWFEQTSMEAERKTGDGLVIGFVGTTSHEGDWGYPVEALVRLKKEHPEITLAVAGFFPEYLQDIATTIGSVPYSLYPAVVRQFDIICCSLDPDDKFNMSKSGIKALEAMSAARKLPDGKIGGAIPVCTDMPVYRRVIAGKNGILVDNNEWYNPLKKLIEDPVLRENYATSGRKWVHKHRDIKNGYRKWVRTYRDLLRRA